MSHINIVAGRLIQAKWSSDDICYPLAYAMTHEDGRTVAGGDYHGEGEVVRDDRGRLLVILGGAMTCRLQQYLVSEAPTADSEEWADGYLAGRRAKRSRLGHGKSQAYADGWAQAWSERRRRSVG